MTVYSKLLVAISLKYLNEWYVCRAVYFYHLDKIPVNPSGIFAWKKDVWLGSGLLTVLYCYECIIARPQI